MAQAQLEPDQATTKEFVFSRTVDAPIDVVWKAHTDMESLTKWWGPKGFKWVFGKLSLKPGGMLHYGMQSPDGRTMWGKAVYREITAPEKLVFVVSFSDEKGGVAAHPYAPNWPKEVLNTTTFEAQGNKTNITLRGIPIHASEQEEQAFAAGFEGMNAGFGGMLDQLEDYLATLS